jgi:hypothetical protein
MGEGRKEAPGGIPAWRRRAGVAAGAIVAGLAGPAATAVGAAPPADVAPQNLSPEEEAQQIAEMGNPPPDSGPADEAPPPDAEETPDGVAGSSDEELAQEPADDEATPAPAPEPAGAVPTPVTPQAPPAPPPQVPTPPVQQPQPAAQPRAEAVKPPPTGDPAQPEHPAPVKRESAPQPPAAQPVQPQAPAPTQSDRQAPPTARHSAGKVTPGARLHVVQSGESLWSIAAELLGDHASPDRIAALVDELWRMNVSRVGSGNPDVIHAGDQLLLP